jgi:DNA-binding transcriptional regulator LsrR (DeoR family)
MRDSEEIVLNAIGSAAAQFIEFTLKAGEVIGISSWSESLLSMVEHMHPPRKVENCLVVQMLGGVGNPSAEQHANRLATRLARLVHGNARFLPAPGVVSSGSAAKVLAQDPYVKEIVALFEKVTLALVGVGSIEPSALVASSGNIFSREELETLQRKGAVGDICLRFYDVDGREVNGNLDTRVIGIDLASLSRVPRSVALCGGKRKFAAILGALRGKWVNTLITDQYTAQRLLKAEPTKSMAAESRILTRIVHKFNPNTPITCFLAWISDFGLPERILVKRSMISGQSELESAERNSLIGKTFACGGLWAPLAGFGSILG